MYMYACKQNDYNATYWASVVPYSIHACTKKHPKPFIRFHRHREWTSYFRVAPTCQNAESPLQVLRCRGPLLQNGDYLLSHLRSTIGVNGLNFSVRNGKRWNPVAIVTLITLYCHIHTNKLSFFSSKISSTDASFTYLFFQSHIFKQHNRTERISQPPQGYKLRAISNARLWRHRLYTCILSTSSSLTTLGRNLILWPASHLDAFSTYPIQT